MTPKQYEKLLQITLDKLKEVETENTILNYEKQHLQMELAKYKKKEDVKQVMNNIKEKL